MHVIRSTNNSHRDFGYLVGAKRACAGRRLALAPEGGPVQDSAGHRRFDVLQAAVQTLLAQARPEETEVGVLHVIELYPLFPVGKQVGPEIGVASEEHRHQAGALVAKAAKALREAGFDRVTTEIEQGSPKVAILDIARDWKADLIVLGSHGRKGLERFPMGSVSEAVARYATCSVQIARIRPKY